MTNRFKAAVVRGVAQAKEREAEIERLKAAYHEMAKMWKASNAALLKLAPEVERLTVENWQLKGALGYPVPGDIPEGPFKCGLCDARLTTTNSSKRPMNLRACPGAMSDDPECNCLESAAEIERLTAKIAYVRQRSQRACEILNEFEATEPKP